MIAILPQNGEERRIWSQKNLLMEASSYFPRQKEEKMAPSTSSVSTAPVISPRCVRGLSQFQGCEFRTFLAGDGFRSQPDMLPAEAQFMLVPGIDGYQGAARFTGQGRRKRLG